MKKMILFYAVLLGLLQAFNGISAVLGGTLLIEDPTGQSLAMKREWLLGTPFATYLIPGIVLLVVNGLGNLTGLWLTIRRSRFAGLFGSALGLIMMVWIIAQVLWIGYKSILQPLYFSTGLTQAIWGYLLARQARKNM
jgi:hypothetical protein